MHLFHCFAVPKDSCHSFTDDLSLSQNFHVVLLFLLILMVVVASSMKMNTIESM